MIHFFRHQFTTEGWGIYRIRVVISQPQDRIQMIDVDYLQTNRSSSSVRRVVKFVCVCVFFSPTGKRNAGRGGEREVLFAPQSLYFYPTSSSMSSEYPGRSYAWPTDGCISFAQALWCLKTSVTDSVRCTLNAPALCALVLVCAKAGRAYANQARKKPQEHTRKQGRDTKRKTARKKKLFSSHHVHTVYSSGSCPL